MSKSVPTPVSTLVSRSTGTISGWNLILKAALQRFGGNHTNLAAAISVQPHTLSSWGTGDSRPTPRAVPP